jgi:hypothetical protein
MGHPLICPVCSRSCPVNEFLTYYRHEDCFTAFVVGSNRGISRNDPSRSLVITQTSHGQRKGKLHTQTESGNLDG